MFQVEDVIAKQFPQLTEKPFLYKSSRKLLKNLMHEDDFKQFEDDYFTLSFTSSHLIHVKNGEEKTRYIEHLKRISKSVVF